MMNQKHYSIAVDGPSGAGKSSLSKKISAAYHFVYLDTGAIYRTVGLAAGRAGIDRHSEQELAAILPGLKIEIRYDETGLQRMFLNGIPLCLGCFCTSGLPCLFARNAAQICAGI